MRVRYPRTSHLPWSPGATADDVRLADLGGFVGREVVVTEKRDGENTTLYRDRLHARSLDSAHHPSRAWVKALHGAVSGSIPVGWWVCGENMHARHSLGYDDLASWFYAFSVWDGDRCLGWGETVRFTRRLGIEVLSDVDCPVVVLGDFNDGTDLPGRVLGLQDAWTAVRGDGTPTFDPVANPLAAVSSLTGQADRRDRVFVRGLRALRAELRGTSEPVSDHYGVEVEVKPLH